MALSNIAVLLARQQHATTPVLMIDWDLEAPGLHHYFEQHEERPGVLEFFEACREQLQRRAGPAGKRDDEALAHEVLDAVGWEHYVSRVDQGSQLYLMRAGRFDGEYGERLAAMQWDSLFDSCPALFRCFAERMARHFRHVLVDSRTGRSDSAGVCTTLLPRKLVVVFNPNRQSLEGVQALVTRATTYRRSHEDEQRPLMVYPLPSRIETGDSQQRTQWRRGDRLRRIPGYQPSFEGLMRDCYGIQQLSLDSYFDEVQLQQTRTFAYGEQVAARMEYGGDRFSLTRSFESLLSWLGPGFFPWQSREEIRLLSNIDQARAARDEGASRTATQLLARDLNLLGELYRREGRLRQALASFEESLSLRQRGLGEDHPDTLASKANLAAALRQQGKLEEALFLDECVVEARERLLGADHPDALAARAQLAASLAAVGRTAEALGMQDVVLATYTRLLGADHLQTLASKAARADLLLLRGDVAHARATQEQVLAARRRVLGAEHSDTLRSKMALASTLMHLQELDAARSLIDAVVQSRHRRLGPDHPETRSARQYLGDVQSQLGMPGADASLVPAELHQDAAMDDYGNALPRRLAVMEGGRLWPRAADELLALDDQLSGTRGARR
nr:tetratricopeptide repeat protein [Duganella callida]